MKIKPKRLLAGLLAGTMSLSTAFTSFAVTDGSSQGNNGAGVVTGAGGDFSANIIDGGNGAKSGKIGIRLSLVNAKNPSEVISVDNNGKPRVVDILYVTYDTYIHQTQEMYHSNLSFENTFINIKTQPLMTVAKNGTEQEIFPIYYDQINNYFSGEANMPPWLIHTNNKYTSQGEEFVNWCTSDSFGMPALKDDGNILSTQTTTSLYGIPYVIEVATKEGTDYVAFKDSLTGTQYSGTKDELLTTGYHKIVSQIMDLCSTSKLQVKTTEQWAEVFKLYLEAVRLYEASHNLPELDDDHYIRTNQFHSDVTDTITRYAKYLNEKNINNPYSDKEYVEDESKMIGDDGFLAVPRAYIKAAGEHGTDILNKIGIDVDALQAASANGNGLTGDIDQALSNSIKIDASDDKRTKSHIEQLLDMPDADGNPVFQTASMIKAREEYGKDSGKQSTLVSSERDGDTVTETYEKKDPTTLAGCEEDWVLLVEPIVWLTIFPEGTDASYIHTKLYGTITNIVQAFNELDGLKAYAGKRTFNYKALNYPVWWALTVTDKAHASGFEDPTGGFVFDRSKDGTPSFGFRPATGIGQYRTFEQLYKSLTQPQPANLSFKYKDEEDGNKMKERKAEVSTIEGWGVNAYWGKEIKKETISSTIIYDKDKNKKPVKIAKWYVYQTLDSNGNVTSETTVDVKTGSISTPVKIENELTEDKKGIWLVTKWGTGTDPNAVPSEGDTRSTFEDYYKKSPGSYGGTKPAVLDLTNDPQEKVLYEKLVITNVPEIPVPGQVTIIKVKEPSTGGNAYIEKSTADPGNYDASETDWDYKEDTQTPNDPQDVHNWSEVPKDGTPGTNPTSCILVN